MRSWPEPWGRHSCLPLPEWQAGMPAPHHEQLLTPTAQRPPERRALHDEIHWRLASFYGLGKLGNLGVPLETRMDTVLSSPQLCGGPLVHRPPVGVAPGQGREGLQVVFAFRHARPPVRFRLIYMPAVKGRQAPRAPGQGRSPCRLQGRQPWPPEAPAWRSRGGEDRHSACGAFPPFHFSNL